MTDTKDGAKDNPRPGDVPGAKRPHATLDLRATELTSEAKEGATGDVPKDPAPAKASTGGEIKPGAPADAKGAAAVKPGAPADAKGAAAAKPGGAPAAAPTPRRGGRVWTHLAAGLLGGALALFGASRYAAELGLVTPASHDGAASEARIAALEEAAKQTPAAPDLTQKLADLEAQLAKVDEVNAKIASLDEQQAKVEAEAKAAADKLAEQQAAGSPVDRIVKLEDRFATLAAAAGTAAEPGQIQGLAALTAKVADLGDGIEAKLAAERKAFADEINSRLAQATEAAEIARTGTQRIDREVSTLRTDHARLAQRVDSLKADTERISGTLSGVQSDNASAVSALAALKSAVEQQLDDVAHAADVETAVSPVTEKLAGMEGRLDEIARNEDERRANVTRVVTALELSNLKRAIDRGAKYANELAEVKRTSGGLVQLEALEAYKDQGVPTMAGLEDGFRSVVQSVMEADAVPTEGGLVDRLLASAKSVVRVRKVSHDADDSSAEAVLGRMETALKEGRLGDVLTLAKELPEPAAEAARPWLGEVQVRYAVDDAIAAVETQLKSSLTGRLDPSPANMQN